MQCVHNKDDKARSDYEEWTPHTTSSNGCLDGRKAVLIRKKPDRECYNADSFTMYYIKEYCECTEDDYHCDYGYVKENGKCVKNFKVSDSAKAEQPAYCSGSYFITDGYRKNFESFCVGGVTHSKTEVKCKGGRIRSFGGFIWWLMKMALLVGVAFYLWSIGVHHKAFDAYDYVRDKFGDWRSSKVNVQSSYSQAQGNGFQTLGSNKRDINSLFEEDDEDKIKSA